MIIHPFDLQTICPTGKKEIIEGVCEFFNIHSSKYEVNTYLRVCHFIAQAAHESAHFRTLQEYASGEAYEGREDLGNILPGDGKLFKGRGIFQLTGRANYKAFGTKLNIDLINNPQLAATPEISVLTALEYWKDRKLNALADLDDIKAITKKINGGYNGLNDRTAYLEKAKKQFKL